MERRTNESPMDFEWERKDPLNPDSPWLKHSPRNDANPFRAQNEPSVFGPTSLDSPSRKLSQNQNQDTVFSAAAPRTILSSSVQRTADQNDLFGAPANPKPPSTRHHELDDNPSIPPLHGLRLTETARDKILSTTTERAVSGRGELSRGKFTEASSKRVQKRRQGGISSPRHRPTARNDYGANTTTDDETSDEAGHHHHPGNLPQPSKAPKPKKRIWNGNGSKWDHHFPVLVSSYLQLFFNIFIVIVVLYLLTSFLRTIQADVDIKVKQSAQKRLSEISECSNQFTANRCGTGYRVPAVEALCAKWEACMNQDPDEVGRAKASAQTFAEILNSLIEPISYKAMFFCTILLFGTLYITNAAFGIYRAKMTVGHHPDPYAPQPPNIHLPQTPIHHRPVAPWGAHPAWSMPIPSRVPQVVGMNPWSTRLEPQTPSKKRFGRGKEEVKQLED
ncbi:Di-sulfide bridge nucleocytoplasmic transport domain-containing protein [Tirmania nivea]|nr:Di-sulfide bridge nucleocytoplasmic transport domain-containing protein [Tirmania nivea]